MWGGSIRQPLHCDHFLIYCSYPIKFVYKIIWKITLSYSNPKHSNEPRYNQFCTLSHKEEKQPKF
jgi:hypothetical protein